MSDDAKTRVIHMVGHGHIDPTWLWRWTEGYEEVRATFRSALDRMQETPGFKFTSSSACFYAWIKACDPPLFEAIKQRVAEGRWEIAGGWWVEPDCNIPGGEAFARHGLYAQRFFAREFGVRATVGFNPDSFGHAGTLPQLLVKMGIERYVYMRPAPEAEMDYPKGTTFWWEAPDGSRVLACNLQESYGTGDDVRERIARLNSCPHLNPGQTQILGFFGVGNHGGGPTKRAIAGIIEAQDDPESSVVRFSTLGEYFDAFVDATPPDAVPAMAQELQHHARGCYAAHAGIKALNRSCEHALMTAERFATAAALIADRPYPGGAIEASWKDVLYNQFHDILAGTSLESSYADSRDQLGRARHTAHELQNEALQVLAGQIDTRAEGNTVVVFNPLPWPIAEPVTAPRITGRELDPPLGFVTDDGAPVPAQRVRTERIDSENWAFVAEVPAFGYRCFHARSAVTPPRPEGPLEAGRDGLENAWWRLEFDLYSGALSRLFDKTAGVEVLDKGNVLAAMVDQSDTWSHGYDEWRVEAGRFGGAELSVEECGAVRATVRVRSTFRGSTAEQCVTLYRGVPAIDCRFRINWQERYTMLKLAYETRIEGGQAAYDAPYGAQLRAPDGCEEPGQHWFDLTGAVDGAPYGLAVLNDAKYSFDVRDGVMRITLLRSPAYAHHDNARYDASSSYAIMDQGWHDVRVRLVPHAGAWTEADVVRQAWAFNEPPIIHVESAHAGPLPQSQSLLSVDAANVVLSVVKQAEDGPDLILRGYETAGRQTDAAVRFGAIDRVFEVTFGPHEIKTLRITRDGAVREVNLLEE